MSVKKIALLFLSVHLIIGLVYAVDGQDKTEPSMGMIRFGWNKFDEGKFIELGDGESDSANKGAIKELLDDSNWRDGKNYLKKRAKTWVKFYNNLTDVQKRKFMKDFINSAFKLMKEMWKRNKEHLLAGCPEGGKKDGERKLFPELHKQLEENFKSKKIGLELNKRSGWDLTRKNEPSTEVDSLFTDILDAISETHEAGESINIEKLLEDEGIKWHKGSLGHEMMHAFSDTFKGDSKDRQGRESRSEKWGRCLTV